MKIEKVILQNVGPHRKLEIDFDSGLIGILGANGAGKSTLVNSIYAALTNDFTRFGASKSDIIHNGAGPRDKSFIELHGSHRNQHFKLTRSLRPNTNKLLYRKLDDDGNWLESGSKSLSKAGDVNQAIEQELGISKLVIDKYVFVAQWDMFQFLSQTESERAKTFQYLCGTEIATKIQKVCTDYVSNQEKVKLIDNSLELEEQVNTFRESMDLHKEKGQKLKTRLLGSDDKNRFKQVLKDADYANKAKYWIADRADSIKAIAASLKSGKKELAKLEQEKENLELKIDNHLSLHEEYHLYVEEINNSSLDTFFSYFVSCQEISKSYTEALAEVERYTKKIEGINVPDLSHPRAVRSNLLSEIDHYNSILQANSSGSTCPTCDQPVSEDYFEAIKAKQEQAENGIQMMQEDIENGEAIERRVNKLISKLQASEREVARAEVTVNHRNENWTSNWAEIDQDELHSFLLQYTVLVSELDAVDGDISVINTGISEDLKEKEILEAKLESSLAAEKLAPSDAELEEATEALKSNESNLAKYQHHLGAWKEAKKGWKRAKETLEDLQARVAKQAKIQILLETIKSTGEVFHWNNLPKSVSQANLELLVHDINENLELFNNPFYVQADEDLTFKVFFPGLAPVKASQLSGGQKVVLAIAFRAALDRVFGRNVGMMFLDEPSSGLDADNVEYLHTALQQLAKKVHGERQLVVITHVQELGGVFDQLIEIGKD